MFRQVLKVASLLACTTYANAHEFWISGPDLFLPKTGTFEPNVWVGEELSGKQFPWRPQAYSSAYWITPSGEFPLHNTRLGDTGIPLRAYGAGLHVLSVESFEQRLTYQKQETFHEFLRDIGRQELIGSKYADENAGPIKERYRRLSKTLVNFGRHGDADKKVGAEGEWVRTPNGYTLFHLDAVVPNQNARIECRSKDNSLWKRNVKTDDLGAVTTDLPASSDCLINAVLLSYQETEKHWHSTWISHFHATE